MEKKCHACYAQGDDWESSLGTITGKVMKKVTKVQNIPVGQNKKLSVKASTKEP